MTIGRFLAGVGALIWDPAADKYLILRRSAQKDFGAGTWECVTGRVDQGESFEEALHREVAEELGVQVRTLFIIGTTHFYRGAERPENELVGVVYGCAIDDPTAVRLSAEHDQARWVTLAEAGQFIVDPQPSEGWLLQVLERAEQLKAILPAELLAANETHGFELSG